jgi:hypothetical protein
VRPHGPTDATSYCKRRSDLDPSQALWDNASVGVTQRVTASGRPGTTCFRHKDSDIFLAPLAMHAHLAIGRTVVPSTCGSQMGL